MYLMLNPHLTYQLISADNGADYNIEDVEEDFPGDEEHMILGIELKGRRRFHPCASDEKCEGLEKPPHKDGEKIVCCCITMYHSIESTWGYGDECDIDWSLYDGKHAVMPR